MKTISLFFALFLSVGMEAGNAAGENSKQIKTSLVMPESMKKQASHHPEGQKVSVYFMVNENGQVIESDARTKDPEAKRDLDSQFMKLNFTGLAPCVRHEVEINFKLY